VDGNSVFSGTGGRTHAPGHPLAIFVHGAGLDHSVWAHQSRWLAFHGWNVLAVDLPGHGRSAGTPLSSIGAMAAWIGALIDAVGAPNAVLLGHSMGALVALEAASQFPARITSVTLIGAAAAMPVHADLLAAAAANDHSAIDMVTLWGYGHAAGLGGSQAPGVWMIGAGQSVLEKAGPGVLHSDLSACNAYRGLAAAARVTAPVLLICGELDQMTPLKSGRALAAALPRAALKVLTGAGHMLMAERPHEVQSAIAQHLAVGSRVAVVPVATTPLEA
jgi:pimeloyl-ACP methyl ester carboxylesterase